QQIRADDPVLKRVYGHFERNLNDILSTAKRAGAKAIVCSVSSNLKDSPPFGSLNARSLSASRKAEWDSLLSSGAVFESQKDCTNALEKYHQAGEIDNSSSELAFRQARCCLASDALVAARDHYAAARDLDSLRFRADTPINRIIRDICARHSTEGVAF